MPTLASIPKTKVPKALRAAKIAAAVVPTGETFIANNGLSYQELSNGNVRRTYPDMPSDEELAMLDSGSVKQRMKALYMLLRAEAPDETVKKNGYIVCRGYKMRYTAGTFEMLDAHNYYKPSAKFNYEDDSARAVADFIFRRNLTKEMDAKKKVDVEPKPVNQMHVAAQKEKQVKAAKVEELKTKKVEKSLEDLRAEALQMIEQTQAKELKPAQLLEVIQNHVPSRMLRVRLGKLIRSYQANEIRMPKLLSALHLTIKEVSFDDRKPAPKFFGVQFYDLVDVRESGSEHLSLRVNGEDARFTTTISEFLARYILSEAPELMVLLMKITEGEEFNLADLQEVDFVLKDKFVEYSERNFSRIKNHAYLQEICEEYLAHNSIPNPLNYVWATTLKKGDKVRVTWMDYQTYHVGVVSNANDGPVRVRYESGDVINLYKHQPVKVLA